MFRILLTFPISDDSLFLLHRSLVEVEQVEEPSLLPARVRYADAVLVQETAALGAELFAHAHRLEVVGVAGKRVSDVDIEAATRRGILVVYAPDAHVIAACEHTPAHRGAALSPHRSFHHRRDRSGRARSGPGGPS